MKRAYKLVAMSDHYLLTQEVCYEILDELDGILWRTDPTHNTKEFYDYALKIGVVKSGMGL